MSGKHPLFSPVTVGNANLLHGVVMAPMSRRRATKNHLPTPLMAEFYRQRASVPGTLLITEATAVWSRTATPLYAPGLWTQEQVEAWKPVTAAVHGQGSFIFAQLWMCGRTDHGCSLDEGGEVIGCSAIAEGPSAVTPRPLTGEEIQEVIQAFADAGRRAIEAGFDGVELLGANGYLLDQFTQDVTNDRTDEWGGSVEARSRFPVAVASAVADAIGASRVGYRLSPWNRDNGMCMANPRAQFTHLAKALSELKLAYLHVIESRIQALMDVTPDESESIDFVADAWGSAAPIIFAGGYDAYSARERSIEQESKGRQALVAFGRTFISNPDLPLRLDQLLPISPYRRDLFYNAEDPKGYIDYKSWDEQREEFEGTEKMEHIWPATIPSAILN